MFVETERALKVYLSNCKVSRLSSSFRFGMRTSRSSNWLSTGRGRRRILFDVLGDMRLTATDDPTDKGRDG